MSSNFINELDKGSFEKLVSLKTLILDNNAIVNIPIGVFSKLFYLEELTLNNNSLEELQTQTLTELNELVRLQRLTLNNNPWGCKCDNATFKTWILEHTNIISNLSSIRCNDTSILDISDIAFLCYDLHTTISFKTSEYYVGPLATFSFLLVLVLIAIFAVYRFRYIIQVLIYNQFGHRFVRQRENDMCMYDAIAIYDGDNRDVRIWIQNVFLNRMEPPFRLFIADRDQIPGGSRCNDAANSIHLSKRTLIVLSNGSYLNRELSFAFEIAYDLVKFNNSFHRIACILLDDAALDEMK